MASYGTAPDENRVSQLRGQVDQVKNVMRNNIEKVNARGEQLDDLGEKAECLDQNAKLFEKRAVKLKKKLRCQHIKLWFILICILAVIVLIIAGIVAAVIFGIKK